MSNIEPEKGKNFADKLIKKFFLIAIITMIGIGLKASLFPDLHFEDLMPKKTVVEQEIKPVEIKPERTKESNQETKQGFNIGQFFNSLFERKKTLEDSTSGHEKTDSLKPLKKPIAPNKKSASKIDHNRHPKKDENHQEDTEQKSRIQIQKRITPNDTIIIRREIMPNGTIKTESIEHKKVKADTLSNWGDVHT